MVKRTKTVLNSENLKLGPGWSATYRPVGTSCPSDCPLMAAGCYAERGRVAMWSDRSQDDVSDFRELDGAARVRWEVSGDGLNPSGTLDLANWKAKAAWHERNPAGLSLSYTHAIDAYMRAGVMADDVPERMSLLASVHSLEEAEERWSQGWRTARVVDRPGVARAEQERYCPYDLAKYRGVKKKTNCANCRLCWAPEHQDKDILFVEF